MPGVPDLVTLRTVDAAVTIDTRLGARAVSWRVDGIELLTGRSSDPVENGMYPMAPWAGRIRGNVVTRRGEARGLPVTYGEWALHGTVIGRSADEVTLQDADAALTATFSTHPEWPWPMTVTVAWRLVGRALVADISVHAHDEAFPAVVGWHPWFRRTLDVGAPAQWFVGATARLRRGADHLPTGDLLPFDPADGPFDDAFVVPDGRARLTWPGALDLAVESDGGWYVIFDELPDALCLEPQSGPPDGLVVEGRPAVLGPPRLAQPGAPLTLHTTWTAGPRDGSG